MVSGFNAGNRIGTGKRESLQCLISCRDADFVGLIRTIPNREWVASTTSSLESLHALDLGETAIHK
jgi:hypothetical protein